MPTVPRYSSNTPTNISALPSSSQTAATPSAFGAATGQGLENLGQGGQRLGADVGQIAEQITRENIQRASKNLYNSYATAKRTLLYGDGTDKNPGFYNLQGEAALNAAPAVTRQLQEIRSNLIKDQSSQKVKDIFTNAADAADETDVENLFKYSMQQREKANDATDKATVENAKNDAIAGWSDPRIIDRDSTIIGETVAQQAARKGLSQEAMQEEVKAAHSDMLEKVIKAAGQFDTKAGRRLQATYKDNLTGLSAAVVDNYLEAKERQDISDVNAHENEGHARLIHAQQANFDQFTAKVQRQEITLPELVEAESLSKISGEQLLNLKNQMSTIRKGDGGDPAEANRLKIMINTGQAGYQDIANNTAIDEAQRSSLIDDIQRVDGNGGVLNRYDIKEAGKRVLDFTGGQKDPFGGDFTDPFKKARASVAIDQFNREITATPVNELTPAKVMEIRDKTIQAYKDTNLPAFASLATRPKSPYFPVLTNTSTKAAWQDQLKKGKTRLSADLAAGKITQEEFTNQAKLFVDYATDIESMVDE